MQYLTKHKVTLGYESSISGIVLIRSSYNTYHYKPDRTKEELLYK